MRLKNAVFFYVRLHLGFVKTNLKALNFSVHWKSLETEIDSQNIENEVMVVRVKDVSRG